MSYLNGLRELVDVSNHRALLTEAQDYYSETSDVEALPFIALAFYKLNMKEDGANIIEKVMSMTNELSFESRLDLASALIEKGDVSSAKSLLFKDSEIQPNNPGLLSRLAKCHWLEGKQEEAIDTQLKVTVLNPECLFERDVLISALLVTNKFNQAQKYLTESLSIYENQLELISDVAAQQLVKRLRVQQIKIWIGNEKTGTVDEWLQDRYDSIDQKEWTDLVILASELIYKKGGYLGAILILENALKISPNNHDISSTIAMLAEGKGDHPKTVHYLTQVCKSISDKDERKAGALVKLAKHLTDYNSVLATSYNEQAERILSALEQSSECSDISNLKEHCQINRACLAAANGNTDQAEEIFQDVLINNPNSETALSRYGSFKIEIGQVAESVTIFEKLKKLNFNAGVNALFQAKQFPEDEETLLSLEKDCRLLIQNKGVGSETLIRLASAWEKIKQYDKAFDLAKEANESIASGLPYDPQGHRNYCARIRATFTKGLIKNRSEIVNESKLPVFVVGMPRSGTTLVEQILASHSEIFGAGETDVISKRVIGLENWENQIGSGRCFPDCVDDISESDAYKLTTDILKDYSDLKEGLKPEASYVVDKLPHNFENIGLIKLLFPNAKIISVRRDPRDIAISNYFIDFNAKYSGMGFAYDLQWIGEQLADHNLLMNHWNELFPGQIHEVNYESLVEDFESVSRKMLDYIGVEWEQNILDFNKLSRSVKTASVWQVRQPVYKTSKAKWMRYRDYLQPLIVGTNLPVLSAPINNKITLPVAGLYLDGNKLYQEGDLDGAELSYKKMLHHNPEHASCNFMVGLIYCRKGRADLAIPLLEKASSHFPQNTDWAKALKVAKELTSASQK